MFRKFLFKRQKKSRVVPVLISENTCETILPTKYTMTKYKINYVSENKNPTSLDIKKEITI